jgi:hemerythrin
MELRWTSDLSVGVQEIDNQHKELFERINSLRTAMSLGKGRTEIGKTVKFLEEYVVEHFSTEEKYMSRYDYGAYLVHKAEHQAFIKDFSEFKKKLEGLESQGGITSFLTIDVQHRLVDWLLNHIGKIDKSLGAFLATEMKHDTNKQ